MSHLHVVGREDKGAPIGSLLVSSARRAQRLGDLGNLLAEYARLRNSPSGDWSRRSCLITAWRWRSIWRGGKPPVGRPGAAEQRAIEAKADLVPLPLPTDLGDGAA